MQPNQATLSHGAPLDVARELDSHYMEVRPEHMKAALINAFNRIDALQSQVNALLNERHPTPEDDE